MRKEETVTIDRYTGLCWPNIPTKNCQLLAEKPPIRPESVQKYLESKFQDALGDVSNAMMGLAKSLSPSQLPEKDYTVYEKFRPEILPGKVGLDFIRKIPLA